MVRIFLGRDTKTLTPFIQDLVFIEEAFERLMLDYDRVFACMGIPACLWRRTGEIYKANREFAELVGVEGYMFRDVGLLGCIPE
jgi:PAS domain-containing protein